MVSPPPLLFLCLLHSVAILGQRQALAFSSSHSLLQSSSFSFRHGRQNYNNFARIKWESITTKKTALSLSSDDNDDFQNNVNVAGVSVSPMGFLVLLQSTTNNDKLKVAFPILLTSSQQQPEVTDYDSLSSSYSSNTKNSSKNNSTIALPLLFQENNDQTSVTSPEALTFLQLLNGVDMATPILPPDTLSLICVWYAFLLAENENGDEGSLVVVEDELGLSNNDNAEEGSNKFQSALDYIRAMVKTTLPPSSSSDGNESQQVNYMDASPWQRARVQLPRAWLHGVRLQEVADTDQSAAFRKSQNDHGDDAKGMIGRIPIQFILECSVDDGSKLLEIPLFAIPPLMSGQEEQSTELQQHVDISNEILQELSQTYNSESSAAFMSLALFHRYNKSGAATADSPILTVSDGLLHRLLELQQPDEDEKTRYCWAVPTNNQDDVVDNDIDRVIQSNGLPVYRTMSQVQEEDQRVLQHLEEQNFGKNPTSPSGNNNGNSNKSVSDNGDTGTNTSDSKRQQRKPTLTLEQQAMQQTLKSAWKIATQRDDKGALEKIQKAMEDLEKKVMENDKRGSNIDPNEAGGGSALQTIQSAMRQQSGNADSDVEEEEEVVGLVSELEEATTSRMGELDTDDGEEEK